MNRTTIPFSLEDSLVILCCCVDPDATRMAEIEHILSHKLDWEYIVYILTQHDIAPLLYKNISGSTHLTLIPPQVLAKLRETYTITAFKNLLMLKTYQTVLKSMCSADIKVMPLKGIALVSEIYQNIAFRSMSDIDIMVQEKDIQRAQTVLSRSDYILCKPFFLRKEHPFHSEHTKKINQLLVLVELHWHIDFPDSPFRISIEDFWRGAVPDQSEGCTYYHLSPEDKVLIYSFHMMRDRKDRGIISLKNLCDLYEIIKAHRTEIDWNKLIKQAEQYKILKLVLLVLRLLEKLFGVALPDTITAAMAAYGLNESMTQVLIREEVFVRKMDHVFIPAGMVASSPEGLSLGINFKQLITTFFITVTGKIKNKRGYNPLTTVLGYTLRHFCISIKNYLKIIYIFMCNPKALRQTINNQLEIKREIKKIDDWICN